MQTITVNFNGEKLLKKCMWTFLLEAMKLTNEYTGITVTVISGMTNCVYMEAFVKVSFKVKHTCSS